MKTNMSDYIFGLTLALMNLTFETAKLLVIMHFVIKFW